MNLESQKSSLAFQNPEEAPLAYFDNYVMVENSEHSITKSRVEPVQTSCTAGKRSDVMGEDLFQVMELNEEYE